MHDVVPVGPQVAGGRLLDVGDALEGRRRPPPQPGQELQQVADVPAAFVEVEGVMPGGDTPLPLDLLVEGGRREQLAHAVL